MRPRYDGDPRPGRSPAAWLRHGSAFRTVTFELSARDLSFVTRDGQRQSMPGRYEVSVGSGQPDTGVPVQSAGFTMDKALPLAP